MKKYFFITVLFLLVTRIIAGEIPNDFLKSDDQEWQAYLKRSLVFPEPSITLESFVQCLKIPHVFERWDDPISPKTKKKILLSATKLLPSEVDPVVGPKGA
jgi:hypothetical protein